MILITIEELMLVINTTPLHKAARPLGISNEMLRHLSQKTLLHLLKILNACICLESVLNQWLTSNIWPISKKAIYNFNLNHTHLITLIDHTRKVFTKILTNRLTNILDRNNILSSQNYAVFPLQLTIQPIS